MEMEMEMEVDDPYAASILLQVCYPRHSPQGEHGLRLIHYDGQTQTQTQTQTHTETLHECRFIDHFPDDYGAIIPPESLGDYLCLTTTRTSQQQQQQQDDVDHHHTHSHDEINAPFVPLPVTTETQTEKVHDYGGDCLCLTPVTTSQQQQDDDDDDDDHYHTDTHTHEMETVSDDGGAIILAESLGGSTPVTSPSLSQQPSCVVSYQILSPPPPVQSPLSSPDHLEINNHHEGSSVNNVEDEEGLWLSKLKSMARLEEGLYDQVISLVTSFRVSKFRLSYSPSPSPSPPEKKLVAGSSSKSRQKQKVPSGESPQSPPKKKLVGSSSSSSSKSRQKQKVPSGKIPLKRSKRLRFQS